MQHKCYIVLLCVILCDVKVFSRKIEKKNEESGVVGNIKGIFHAPNQSLAVIEGDLASYYGSAAANGPPSNLPRGPHFGFLTNICNALMSLKFNIKYLGKYFLILSRSLEGLGINFIQKIWIKRFRKKLKKYSIYNRKTLTRKVNDFLLFISEEKPKKNHYFKAMNAIYTVVDDMKMDDYVYLLKIYGKGDRKHIGDDTRRVFERIVFGRYHKQPAHVKKDIELKFKSAVVEYWEERFNGTGYNFTLGHLFKFTLNHP